MAEEGIGMTYEDIHYVKQDGVATITIDRPKVMNAFRGQTIEELIDAVQRAGWNRDIGVIVLTGAGDRAFCTGGDQQDKKRSEEHTSELQSLMRQSDAVFC